MYVCTLFCWSLFVPLYPTYRSCFKEFRPPVFLRNRYLWHRLKDPEQGVLIGFFDPLPPFCQLPKTSFVYYLVYLAQPTRNTPLTKLFNVSPCHHVFSRWKISPCFRCFLGHWGPFCYNFSPSRLQQYRSVCPTNKETRRFGGKNKTRITPHQRLCRPHRRHWIDLHQARHSECGKSIEWIGLECIGELLWCCRTSVVGGHDRTTIWSCVVRQCQRKFLYGDRICQTINPSRTTRKHCECSFHPVTQARVKASQLCGVKSCHEDVQQSTCHWMVQIQYTLQLFVPWVFQNRNERWFFSIERGSKVLVKYPAKKVGFSGRIEWTTVVVGVRRK